MQQKDDITNLQKQIDEININMQQLLSGNKDEYKMDKDRQEFKDWIEKELKLPQYYDLFVKNGVETLKVMQMFTMNELKDIGISKIGHRMQILHAVIQSKQKSSDKAAEGDTAYI